MMTQTLTPEQVTALGIAQAMAAAGIPIFIAHPDAAAKTGFRPPRGWEKTAPDPGVVDQWRPGLALCAVMGCGFDLADIDPRNGGDVAALNGSTPRIYGVAATPSGGTHLFIASLCTGSRDNVYPGIDIKGGQPDGSGRGFAFLAPTVRASVVTGEPSAYRWLQIPDLTTLDPTDESGAALANRIRDLRASSGGMRSVGGPDWWRSFLASREPQAAPAAERAIADKLAEVSSWNTQSGGGFRTVLLRAALTLGGYVGGGYLDEYEARQRLEAAVAAVWGSPDPDDLLWIQQGLDDGAVQPFHVFTEADARQHSDVAQAVAGESEVPRVGDGGGPVPPWSVFSVLHSHFDPAGDGSDQGLAKAVAYQMYPALRYATDSGLWIKRGEMVWEEASDDLSDWIISIMAELMPLGSTPVPKEATDRTEQHWQAVRRAQFMSSAGAGKIARKLRAIIRSDHPASLRSAALDTNPEVLWAGGVPWDLRASGEVPTPASWIDPNTPHLRTALCAPDPTVPTPRWDAFLAVVLPDPELRAWALRVLSIALTGYPDAACPILYGRERSGKSSLVEMLVTVLGSYAHAANPKLLSAQDNSHDTIVYDLKGRRLSFIDEGPKRGHEATERLKQLTGGASLTARAMRANPVTFAPTHTLVMTTNNEPHLTDPALRARMRLIPCDADEAIVRPTRLPLLGQGLIAEAPGILAAMMRETAAYLADRDSASTTAAPASIRGLAQEMAEGQDPVREWVDNCTVPADPGTPSRALYTSFARWHQDSPLYRRMSVPSETTFGRTLTEMGHAAAKVAGHRYRPLSVLSGPAGVAPWEPMPAEHMTRGTAPPAAEPPAKSDAGTPVGGLLGGLKTDPPAEPANPENPSSTPIFSSSLAGMAGYYPLHTTEKDTDRYRENTEEKAPQPATPPSSGEKTAADLQKPSNPEGLDGTRQRSSSEIDQQASPPTEDPSRSVIYKADRDELSAAEIKAGLDAQRELGLPLTDTQERNLEEARKQEARVAARERNVEVARRAAEAGISKAEVRAQLKAEQRAVAIREAAGEVLPLPAVVDRLGNVLPLTLEQARDVVRAAVARSGALTVDVETSGYPVGHADYELRSVQLGDEAAAVVFHPVDHADEIQAQLGAAPALHAHSATADLVPLTHAGLVDADAAWARMHDTVIPAKLADPASTGSDPGLKQLAGAVLGESSVAPAAEAARAALFKAGKWLEKTKVDTPVERSGWAQVETGSTTMLRYAASDVLDTAALARVLPRPASAVYERERIAQLMTARVTHRGVRLDREQIAALTERHTAGRADAASRVRAFGVDNPGSDQQVGQAAAALGADLPQTATGRPSVAVGVLEPLKDAPGATGELVSAVLDYRHHDTALGLFLAPYRLLCDRGDSRARPTIYTLGTDTGRMSAVRPNLQQLPREGGVRACITADPGQLMISADFSGVEIRVAAALSQDATLLRFLQDDRDLHWEVARMVYGPDATKAHRYRVKRGVFGRLYGGGVPTLAMQMGVPESVARKTVEALDALTPQLSAWSHSIREAVKHGQTQFSSYSGRVIHLPREFPHKGPNYCLALDTPILRSDLEHVAASKVQVGDRLVGFDEYPLDGVGGTNKYHHMRTAVVEATSVIVKPSVRVHTADGKTTECSADHLWLARPLKGRKNNRPRVRWVRADQLQPGDDLLSLGTWDVAEGRTAGYLAGLYDGEGSLQCRGEGSGATGLHFSQLPGPVMDAFCAGMVDLGLPHAYYKRPPNSTSPTDSVVVAGIRNIMRVLGTLQPRRFRHRLEGVYEGAAITAGLTNPVVVTAVEPAGDLELASIQTSTRTLIANGYLSHNCIQGTARELLVDSLVKWRDTQWGACTLLPVHDELDVFVPAEDAEAATRELVRCMEVNLFGVKIIAEPSKPAFAWADSA